MIKMVVYKDYCKTISFLILAVINFALFIRQGLICISQFTMDSSSVSSFMKNTADAEFPALTICPDYNDAFRKKELEKFNITKLDIRRHDFTKFNSSTLSTLEQFERVTQDLQDVIEKFTIELTSPLEGSEYTKVSYNTGKHSQEIGSNELINFLNENDTDWRTQYYMVFGKCFTYNIPKNHQRSQVASISVKVKLSSLLYIHHPGQFFWVDSDTKVPITPNKTSYLNVQHVVVYSRPVLSEENGDWTCDPKLDRGYDDCLKEAHDKLFLTKLGCYHPFMTKTKEPNKHCNYGNFTKHERKLYLSIYKGLNSVRYSGACSAPCASIDTYFGIPDTQDYRKGNIHLKLYFRHLINVKEDHVAYPIGSLFAELGGYMGLLLGISLMDLGTILANIGSMASFMWEKLFNQ